MKKTLVISLLLTACGNNDLPDFDCVQSFDAGGMTFCLESEVDNINTDIVEDLVSLIEQEVQKRYPEISGIRNMLQATNTLVVVSNAMFVTDCQEVRSTGTYVCDTRHKAFITTENGVDFVFVMMPSPKNGNCFADRFLMHEILHSVIWHFIDGSDKDHGRPYFFLAKYGGTVDKESIEDKMIEAIENELKPLYPKQCGNK